jgi:hypothetical protein
MFLGHGSRMRRMMHDPPLKDSANNFERQDKITHGQRDASRRNDSYNHGGGGFFKQGEIRRPLECLGHLRHQTPERSMGKNPCIWLIIQTGMIMFETDYRGTRRPCQGRSSAKLFISLFGPMHKLSARQENAPPPPGSRRSQGCDLHVDRRVPSTGRSEARGESLWRQRPKQRLGDTR